MARILIATDAWHPQVNGVVRTLDTTVSMLRRRGHEVVVVEPSGFFSLPVPFYREIRVSLPIPGTIDAILARARPDHIHIATEGPIGWLVRRVCLHRRWRFTTSYHTRFPEYLAKLMHVPPEFTYRQLLRFHAAAASMMVATPSLEAELRSRGFRVPMRRWSRGVDLRLFHPRAKPACDWPRPIQLYVGRVSHEKGIDEFLGLDTPGTKVVVGDGPARAALECRFPAAKFLGAKCGEALANAYAAADVFVFPSRTDTFGIVIIEALASGLPIAAYPVTGPIDLVLKPEHGCLNQDLKIAVLNALAHGDPKTCVEYGRSFTWSQSVGQFEENLVRRV